MLLHFDQPVLTMPGAVMISTKLDLDYEQAEPSCRILFCGNVVHIFRDADEHKCLKLSRVRSHRSAAQEGQEMCLLAVESDAPPASSAVASVLAQCVATSNGSTKMTICCISNSMARRYAAGCSRS